MVNTEEQTRSTMQMLLSSALLVALVAAFLLSLAMYSRTGSLLVALVPFGVLAGIVAVVLAVAAWVYWYENI